MLTQAARLIRLTAVDRAVADGAAPCDECDGLNPGCSACGGEGVLADVAEMTALAGVRFSPYITLSFEAFALTGRTNLLPPLKATSLNEALAETTARWAWDRNDRLGIREIGDNIDRLHVYAVRRKSVGMQVWNGHIPATEHQRWLDHICTVDLNVIAGIAVDAVGVEVQLHEHRQRQRPAGARLSRELAHG